MGKTIKYSIPFLGVEEEKALKASLLTKKLEGDSKFCRLCEKRLKKILKSKSVFLTTSGTHALELALMALGIKKGDEVICPSFTFVSTANAIIRQGAKPVFCEIERDTLNLDIDDVVRKITRKTRAVIPVHYGGLSCDMNRLVRICSDKNIRIIEDAAQSIGAKYNGKSLGTFGDFGCLSFHNTKNISSGEGGAIIANRKKFEKNIQIIREKGTNRFLYLEGKIKKYTWVGIGSSFIMSDLLAAVLCSQLNKMNEINKKRRSIFNTYLKQLKKLEKKGLLSLPHPDKKSFGNGHIFWILLKKDISRSKFIREMRKRGIECTHHYVPLHSSPFARKHLRYKKSDLPLTEEIAERLVRLPMHAYITMRDAKYVVKNVNDLLMKGF